MGKVPINSCRFFRPSPAGLIDHLSGLTDHSTIEQQLSGLHKECCHPELAEGLPNLLSEDQIEKIINDLLKAIFKNRSIASAPEKLKQYFVDQFFNAVTEGYGFNLEELDYDTPDYKMLEALRADIVKFSAAKNDAMNKAIGRELVGPDGTLRSFKDFRNAAYNIANDHTDVWLKAEYNLAIVSAQSASKWVRIEADADALPILEFDAVMDGHTTEICRNFNGIRLPYTDPFWDMYYIPNHYGERSTIRQDTDDAAITDTSTIVYPDKIPDIFKMNLAKNKMVFPPGHPYYNSKHG